MKKEELPYQKERVEMMEGPARIKSREFAIRVIKAYQYLREEKREYVLSKQFLRSGTSIGANLAEAECAISRNDFLAKVYISFKECAETLYWLELLHETKFLTAEQYSSLHADCKELHRILSSTTKTMKDAK
ncbi:MAG: four helix bundle protein [Selenomonadaceae bacterium]|nr:four helix bundle protein [Selenomonadaceae bacterium]